MDKKTITLAEGKKLFFASDFHLGAPNHKESRLREQSIVRWLDSIQKDASGIFLVGDIFDFWFEYKSVIPKGFVRFQGKLAELSDKGIQIYLFGGNHDMWMSEYFEEEMGIPVFNDPVTFRCNQKDLLISHGDGLGPDDKFYKIVKKVFRNSLAIKAYGLLHPDLGVGLAYFLSNNSRKRNINDHNEFKGDDEWLVQYCKIVEKEKHHDYYIFGHRHLSVKFPINEKATYVNLGEWIFRKSYAIFDGNSLVIENFSE